MEFALSTAFMLASYRQALAQTHTRTLPPLTELSGALAAVSLTGSPKALSSAQAQWVTNTLSLGVCTRSRPAYSQSSPECS